ncbi:helicase [uncultured Thalassolituus sp.]|uniref:helicase n=1 Tax=uncultured Thalassolituus sp. TaxID=285273 RepID=UPI00262EE341|nr:helicase [uncultured Thalassolituus sp.]
MIKFRLLLWLMARMMKKAAKTNAEFRAQLEGQDFVFQIQTEDKQTVRHFVVKDGKVKSKGKAHADPAFTISFVSAHKGLKIMTAKDRNAFMRGIQEKDILLSGDLTKLMWFQGISKYLKP